MSVARYFQDELDTLRVFGEIFSRYHPKLASYLSERGTDPDVERLLEGFALLTARLREKIDDQLPEVTQSLLMLLWPNFLRPVPSMCILQLDPIPGSVTERAKVSKDFFIDSTRIDGTSCRFQPTRDTDILPLAVGEPSHDVSREKSVVTIPLHTLVNEPLGQIKLDQLRFYLGGSAYSAMTINMWLHRYLATIKVRSHTSGDTAQIEISNLKQGGIDNDDDVLPYPKNAFTGYRLLQEFYAFPEKFLFFDLEQIPVAHVASEPGFDLVFEFSRPLPPDVRVEKRGFRLHCVPAINLFPHDAEPISLDGKRVEYPVIPADRDGGEIDIFSIDTVTGWIDDDGPDQGKERRNYPRFESFEHEIERADDRTSLYFREKVRQHVSGDRLDRLISFFREDETAMAGRGETISLSLTCSNGLVPHELAVGDLSIAGSPIPAFVEVTNITRPTLARYPVIDGALQWQLVSALSLNYLSLEDAEALRLMLRIYDFDALVDRQKERQAHLRQEGLARITTTPIDRMFRGLPVRGTRSTIEMRESRFASEGEMFLFATVLAEFFRLYASVNSFHELIVKGLEKGEEYRWTAHIGNQPLI